MTNDFDFRSPEIRRDPHGAMARLRQGGPLHRDLFGTWLVLRHAEVSALLKDPRLGRDLRRWKGYSLIRPYLADSVLEKRVENWLLSLDGAAHTRLRRLVMSAFTPQAVAALRPTIEKIADELLADCDGSFDLMSGFAQPFPVRVMLGMLGIPVEHYARLRQLSDAMTMVVEPTASRRRMGEANQAAIALTDFFQEHIAERRARPTDDLLGRLVRAEEAGDRIDEDELLSMLLLLFVAGHDTTSNLIGNGVHALLTHPAEVERLRADLELVPTAVEELLRFDGPANILVRVAFEPIEVLGQKIEPGESIFCLINAANRDPEAFERPDELDLGRRKNPHLAFGGGPHYCIGAQLARLEAEIAFRRLMTRAPLALAGQPTWRDCVNLRGLQQLPVRA
jgi:cytochrome P450